MPSLTCFNVRFTPSWLMITLTVVFVSFFCKLGFWQIQRSEQKARMVKAEQAMAQKKPSLWSTKQKLPQQYQRIKIAGHYLSSIFLLDNQHQQHQFGYDVLSPLLLEDGSVVLIDRGWLPGENTRQTFPQITTPTSFIKLQGTVYFPSNNQWVLGPDIEKKSAQLTILENINVKNVQQILQKKVYPFIIRLNEGDMYGFTREWAIVSMPPERHLAYAWQWFAMALAVFIIFLSLNLKKNESTKK